MQVPHHHHRPVVQLRPPRASLPKPRAAADLPVGGAPPPFFLSLMCVSFRLDIPSPGHRTRAAVRAAGVPEARLAAMAGVHAATVRQVVSGRTWGQLPPGDASRGASVLLSLPELLTGREAMLVSTALALALAGGARDDHAALYLRVEPTSMGARVARAALLRRGPSQLAVDALSHPSRWRRDGA
jgi:hypothetical protein